MKGQTPHRQIRGRIKLIELIEYCNNISTLSRLDSEYEKFSRRSRKEGECEDDRLGYYADES